MHPTRGCEQRHNGITRVCRVPPRPAPARQANVPHDDEWPSCSGARLACRDGEPIVRETGYLSPPIWACLRWGLPCRRCHHRRGALLPHHFTLTGRSKSTWAVYFLWHFPSGCPGLALPTTVPCPVRTFLQPPSRMPAESQSNPAGATRDRRSSPPAPHHNYTRIYVRDRRRRPKSIKSAL